MSLADTFKTLNTLVSEITTTFGAGSDEALKALDTKKSDLDKAVGKIRNQLWEYGENVRDYTNVRVALDSFIDQIHALPQVLDNDPGIAWERIERFQDEFQQRVGDALPIDLGPGDAKATGLLIDQIESELDATRAHLKSSDVRSAREGTQRIDDLLDRLYRNVNEYFHEVAKDLRAVA